MQLTRRGILIGSLAAGGLVVGALLRPRRFAMPVPPGPDEFAFDAWIKIDREGTLTVAVPQLEMGQGVTTLLPQVAATELGADWSRVVAEPAPPSGWYANRPLAARWASLWMPALPALADDADALAVRRWAADERFGATADGTSLAAYEAPLREAAAAARTMLTMAAAARWDVPGSECATFRSRVYHGDKALDFAEIVEDAAGYPVPSDPTLRQAPAREDPATVSEVAQAGAPGVGGVGAETAFPRLDGPAKAAGALQFAGDIRLPGMLYAAIRHAPIGAARLASYDEASARAIAGYHSLVTGGGEGQVWLAALADNWWSAERALEAAAPQFAFEGGAESEAIAKALGDGLEKGDGQTLVLRGEADATSGALPVEARYEAAPALHATLETASATARIAEGRLDLWIGSQVPETARRAAARAAGVSLADAVIFTTPSGGSFDRRLDCPEAAEVATLARAAGRPVQLTWARREEFAAGWPRAPVAALMSARTDDAGRVSAWRARIAAPATMAEFAERLFEGASPGVARKAQGRADPFAVAGAGTTYAIPNVAVVHVPVPIALPTARLRGQAHGLTAFFTESFVDELAHMAEAEPLSYRMALLGQDPRLAECLQRVAGLAGWDGGGAGSGQGVACHAIDTEFDAGGGATGGGRIAAIASARFAADGIRVEAIRAVADIGRVVNRDLALQQIEGGLLFGMGLALGSSTGYAKGRALAKTLSDLSLPRLARSPRIEVTLVESDAPPFDPGELGAVIAAPVIGNALHSATGVRFRRLPFFADEV